MRCLSPLVAPFAVGLALGLGGSALATETTDPLLKEMERAIAERDGTALAEATGQGEDAALPGLVDGSDPAAILRAALAFGEAEFDTDGEGDPMIRGDVGGYRYVVFFYGCSEGQNCTGLLLRAAFVTLGQTEADMAEWNRTQRFGTAFLDEEGDPVLEMDLNLFGGVSPANLEDSFDWWRVIVGEFAKRIGH
ncbi:MAG: YbjN domain-containing protein [Pseudomonadota bacterium]